MTKPSATGVTTVKLSAAIAALAEIPGVPATLIRRSVLAASMLPVPRVEQAVGGRALEVTRSGEPAHQVGDQVHRRRGVEAQPARRQLECHHVRHCVTGREVQDRRLGQRRITGIRGDVTRRRRRRRPSGSARPMSHRRRPPPGPSGSASDRRRGGPWCHRFRCGCRARGRVGSPAVAASAGRSAATRPPEQDGHGDRMAAESH